MSIEEQYRPVTHKHPVCLICNGTNLIEDIPMPRNAFDNLLIAIRNMNASARIMVGKRIEVREDS